MSSTVPHVAVLKGGWSAEREVSLVSGAECAGALVEEGYRVTEIDVDRNVGATLAAVAPDVAFNVLHGRWGEDGCVQGLLETMDIPYTHSGVLASSVAMNKPLAKRVFRDGGIACPEGVVVDRHAAASHDVMPRPYVVKPVTEGSSVGVHIAHEGKNSLPEAFTSVDWAFGDDVLVERYIPGRELTVVVMDNRALAVTEILPQAKFYDYEAKYASGGSTHVIPADVPPAVYDAALDIAQKAHRLVGCRGVSRADFRWDDSRDASEGLYLLEINTQPGMTPTSLVPEQAAHQGITFGGLCRWLVEDASCAR